MAAVHALVFRGSPFVSSLIFCSLSSPQMSWVHFLCVIPCCSVSWFLFSSHFHPIVFCFLFARETFVGMVHSLCLYHFDPVTTILQGNKETTGSFGSSGQMWNSFILVLMFRRQKLRFPSQFLEIWTNITYNCQFKISRVFLLLQSAYCKS